MLKEIILLMLYFSSQLVFLIWFFPIAFMTFGTSFPKYSIKNDGKFLVRLMGGLGHIALILLLVEIFSKISIIGQTAITISLIIINVLSIGYYYYLTPYFNMAFRNEDIFWNFN